MPTPKLLVDCFAPKTTDDNSRWVEPIRHKGVIPQGYEELINFILREHGYAYVGHTEPISTSGLEWPCCKYTTFTMYFKDGNGVWHRWGDVLFSSDCPP